MPDAYHNISCVWDTVIMPPDSERAAWPNALIKRWWVQGVCIERVLCLHAHSLAHACRMLVARIVRSGYNVLSLDDGAHARVAYGVHTLRRCGSQSLPLPHPVQM